MSKINKNFENLIADNLASSTRERSAHAPSFAISPYDLDQIKEAAHHIYTTDGRETVAHAYVQATLNYLWTKGLLK